MKIVTHSNARVIRRPSRVCLPQTCVIRSRMFTVFVITLDGGNMLRTVGIFIFIWSLCYMVVSSFPLCTSVETTRTVNLFSMGVRSENLRTFGFGQLAVPSRGLKWWWTQGRRRTKSPHSRAGIWTEEVPERNCMWGPLSKTFNAQFINQKSNQHLYMYYIYS